MTSLSKDYRGVSVHICCLLRQLKVRLDLLADVSLKSHIFITHHDPQHSILLLVY